MLRRGFHDYLHTLVFGRDRRFLSAIPLPVAALVLMVACASGCGTSVGRRFADPTFDAAAIEADGLAIAVVVVAGDAPGLDDATEISLTRLLDEEVRAHRIAPPPREPGVLLQTVPGSGLVAVLDRYRRFGTLTATELAILQAAAAPSRFQVFARVESDAVDRTSADSKMVITNEDAVADGQTWSARRTVAISFDVFDLRESRLVWSARMEREDTNRRGRVHSVRDPVEDRTTPVSDAWGEEPQSPDPPQRLDLLRDLFRRFAAELPG